MTEQNYCPNCGMFEMGDSAKYCSTCGTKLSMPPQPKFCTNCHKATRLHDTFCPFCGRRVKK